MLSVNASSLSSSSGSPGQGSLAGQVVVDEQGKKREIRLMKNRYMYIHVLVLYIHTCIREINCCYGWDLNP